MKLPYAAFMAIIAGISCLSCYRPIYDEALALAKQQDRSWSVVGSADFTGGLSTAPSLAVAPDGTPFVGFVDGGAGNWASVMYMNGSDWSYLGSRAFTPDSIWDPSIAIDSGSRCYLAFRDVSQAGRLSVYRYDSPWVPVGLPGFSANTVLGTSLALDSAGTPYVGYLDASAGDYLTVKKFDGANWVPVGTDGFSPGVASYTSLAFGLGGSAPHVGFRDHANGFRATVMRFDGSSWISLGPPGFSGGVANYTSLAVDSSERVYIGFQEGGSAARVMRYNGSGWMDLGDAGSVAGNPVDRTSLAISRSVVSKDCLYLAYSRQISFGPDIYSVSVMKSKGMGWEIVGTPDFFQDPNPPGFLQIAISPDDGTPYVSIQCSGIARVMAFR